LFFWKEASQKAWGRKTLWVIAHEQESGILSFVGRELEEEREGKVRHERPASGEGVTDYVEARSMRA